MVSGWVGEREGGHKGRQKGLKCGASLVWSREVQVKQGQKHGEGLQEYGKAQFIVLRDN